MTTSVYLFCSLLLAGLNCLGQPLSGDAPSGEGTKPASKVQIGTKTLYFVQRDSSLLESQVKRGEVILSGGSRAFTGGLIPAFSLSDQNGKSWNESMFSGRKTIVGIWASWCVACRGDLRILQALNDSLPPQSDIQVVTLNIDEDVAMARRFISENKLSLPVLMSSHSYISSFLGTVQVAIPRHWTVSNTGRLSDETIGAIVDEKAWLGSVLSRTSQGTVSSLTNRQ